MVCMDSQKAECKIFLKSDHKIKEKGRCRQKELHLLFHLTEKFVTIKVLHGRENVTGIKENVMREIKCPEDSDPFQDVTVLKEAFDRLNKYVVG